MSIKTKVLVDGMTFTEGPRWKDGKLYFSDFFSHKVFAVNMEGHLETVIEIPYQPSGLGWMPDGQMLIVSMNDQKLLSFSNNKLTEVADLSKLATHFCNDMVVDKKGNAYIGNFGFDLHSGEPVKSTNIIMVKPGEEPKVVAEDVFFPNGSVITPDDKTLIVGETFSSLLTAFDIGESGLLSNRRIWADLRSIQEGYSPVPDGICLDAEGAIWVASPTTNDVIRVKEGGELLEKIELDRGAFACMLGGEEGNTLFISTANGSEESVCLKDRSARIETIEVSIPRAGLP